MAVSKDSTGTASPLTNQLSLFASSAAATASSHCSSILEHLFGHSCYSSVYPMLHRRTRFPLVMRFRFAPLSRANVCGIKAFGVNSASSFGANWEALTWSKETLLSTVSKHNSSCTTSWGNFPPACPRHGAATSPTALGRTSALMTMTTSLSCS